MSARETRYDAIVIGAGHNGLAAAVLLQKAGLRTLCLESKLYAGGMASTVELFDGYQFEIAGSVQFPTAPVVRQELGLDTLPTIDLDVMSVALRGVGDDPMVQYSDPDQAVHPSQRGARGRGRQRHGGTDGLGPGADAGAGPIRCRRVAQNSR